MPDVVRAAGRPLCFSGGTGFEPSAQPGGAADPALTILEIPMLKSYVIVQNYLAGLLNRDDRGATAVEYGLIVALIAAVIVAIVFTLGQQILAAFTTVSNRLPAA
jgi:pilus assembly protein Flp/PilA